MLLVLERSVCLLDVACNCVLFVDCCLLLYGVVICLVFVVDVLMFVVRSSPLLFVVLLVRVRWCALFAVCW